MVQRTLPRAALLARCGQTFAASLQRHWLGLTPAELVCTIFRNGVAANPCADKRTKLASKRGRTNPFRYSILREEATPLKEAGKDAAYGF